MTFYYKDLSSDKVNETVTTVGDITQADTKYAAKRNGIIYIQDKASKRYVTFKSYLKSFNLSVSPTIELDESIFVLDPFVSRGQTLFRYSISLEVPANNIKEAAANLAKMQELFRYVGTLGASIDKDEHFYPNPVHYNVYFSNLICKGDEAGGPPSIPFSNEAGAFDAIAENGITGIIKKIEYKPSLDTGFFENQQELVDTKAASEREDTFLALYKGGKTLPLFVPKHYTLNLELLMINSHDSLGSTWPFMMRIF